MGGSIVKHGGQNPLEPVRYGCKIIHGPNVENFNDVYKTLLSATSRYLLICEYYNPQPVMVKYRGNNEKLYKPGEIVNIKINEIRPFSLTGSVA